MPERAGDEFECLSIPVQLEKDVISDGPNGRVERVGFRIGGGVDQDPKQSPFGYPDAGVYVTHVDPDSPAHRAGIRQHDKILQVNGYDFTTVTHAKAVKYIQKFHKLNMLLTRNNI